MAHCHCGSTSTNHHRRFGWYSKTLRLLVELNSWYRMIYNSNDSSTLFMRSIWSKMLNLLNGQQDAQVELGHTYTYTVAMPKSLNDTNLHPVHFYSDSSLVTTSGLSDKATFELVGALLDQLNSDFGCKAHSTDLVCGELAKLEGPRITDKPAGSNTVILLGGSHLKRSLQYFKESGITVIDLSIPGWLPTEANIARAITEVKNLDLGNCIAICDLVSNVAYRFEQLDGQLLLAEKSEGRYHMKGKVTTCPRNLLANILYRLRPLLEALSCYKICLAPLPRYLFAGCCEDEGHCSGVGEDGYALDLYKSSLTLRKNMRELLTGYHSKLSVPELYSTMFPNATNPGKVVDELRKISDSDGVHLTPEGYELWTKAIVATFEPTSAAGKATMGPAKTYFWRGFVSPHGSERPQNHAALHLSRQPGGGKWKKPDSVRGNAHGAGGSRGGALSRGTRGAGYGHGVRGAKSRSYKPY